MFSKPVNIRQELRTESQLDTGQGVESDRFRIVIESGTGIGSSPSQSSDLRVEIECESEIRVKNVAGA
ncbi:hypothetical protein EVAR_90312_1 [Eumeta japonica]|uniref:Uncharacterized protein n=1 Tax=Eumeta variegata TaxID=151549 RepID=A0A4C1ZQ19_EUMVA|nr:hypothetical protein EVAR_90312_1 [Eumeta japonica]